MPANNFENFETIESVANKIKIELDLTSNSNKTRVIALFAFNATGKTRLSNIINNGKQEEEEIEKDIKVLCYNSYFEDIFFWDNENNILTFSPDHWIIKLIIEQGLENKIFDTFNDIVSSKIEPLFDFESGKATFNFASGDSNSTSNIKISRGEESMLIWSIFYTILKEAIDTLNSNEADRSTPIFNSLKHIIIDDPISSIDDTKIIKMAVKLTALIGSYQKDQIKILITTHHALFYNVIVNSLKNSKQVTFKPYLLSKADYTFSLSHQGDSPFAYHLTLKDIIKTAIDEESIEKYHYNLFRNLLEKTANFLGYNDWRDCLDSDNKEEFARILNLYSHSKLSDLEATQISYDDKNLFTNVFNNFIEKYNWSK
jgi:hypothetical protein